MISFPAIERLQSVDSIGCFTWSASVSTISLAIPRSTAAWTPCKHATPLRPRRRPDSRIWCRAPPSCWDYFSVAVSYDVAQPPSPVSFRQAEASQLIFRVPSSGRCHFWEVQILTLGSFPSYCAKLPVMVSPWAGHIRGGTGPPVADHARGVARRAGRTVTVGSWEMLLNYRISRIY
jgi:hypothetical protein